MILTVTPDPALDKTYWVDRLVPPAADHEEVPVLRARRSMREAGGKGINVAMFLARMGMDAVAMGFLAGHTGRMILRYVLEEGVTANFVWVAGENRTTVTVLQRGQEFAPLVIHEAGPQVPSGSTARFLKKYDQAAARAEYVVLGGRLPPGLAVDFYRDLAHTAKARGAKVVLHTGGAPLWKGMEAGPFLVKPDIRDPESLTALPAGTEDDILQAGRRAMELGVDMMLVSHHVTGDVLITPDSIWDLDARIQLSEFRNLMGADDALVGGILYRLAEGDELEAAVRFGMAAAVASSEAEEKLCRCREDIEREMARIEIHRRPLT